jgi:hypothetical protein
MRMKGNMDSTILDDSEDSKQLRIELGQVRCPKCHKSGQLAVYILASETIAISVRIMHIKEPEIIKECFLESKEKISTYGEKIIHFLPRVYGSI